MFNLSLNKLHKPQIAVLIVGILLAALLPLGINVVIKQFNFSYHNRIIYSLFVDWIVVGFLFLYATRIEKQPLLIWIGNDSGVGFTLLSVLVLYVADILVGVISSIPSSFGHRESNELMRIVMQVLRGHPLLIFFVSITAGVTEELIFRGYILTRLSAFFKKPYFPVIISSVIFSALHYKYHSLREFIFTFLFGVVCSVYYIRYRNIHALILIHFLADFIAFTVAQYYYF
jgi:membrane protease YdiL (CAAX protease family)